MFTGGHGDYYDSPAAIVSIAAQQIIQALRLMLLG